MWQPNDTITFLGAIFEKVLFSFENGLCNLKSVNRIIPITVSRIDKMYLMTRSNEAINILTDKKILLIGCGSVGSYIANELVKSGIEKMMLIDDDHLYEINVFRHLLGLEYVGQYKCVALQNFLEKNIPDLKILSLVADIEDAVQEGSIEFEDYDLIISATGSHKDVYKRQADGRSVSGRTISGKSMDGKDVYKRQTDGSSLFSSMQSTGNKGYV